MIYIGSFLHTTNQQEASEVERRHGEFHLIVEAENRYAALEYFRERIRLAREKSTFFEGESRIFLNRMMAIDKLPHENALLFSYKSIAGDPMMPFIGCPNPSEDGDGCRIINWNENVPEIDGNDGSLFMKFDA